MKKVKKKDTAAHTQSQPRLFFPHILRIIAARIGNVTVTCIWLFLFTTVALNSFSDELIDRTFEQQLQRFVLNTPFKAVLHENLGQFYLPYNSSAAFNEFRIADYYNQVLGMQTQKKKKIETVTAQNNSLFEQLTYWRNVSNEFPDYTYALMKQYELETELGNKKESSLHLIRLETLIPGNTTLEGLKRQLD